MWFTATMAIWFLSACGGGSDAPVGTVPTEYITISEKNAELVLASTVESVRYMKDLQDILPVSNYVDTQESGTISCSGGGSVSYDGTDTQATLTFNNCIENGVYLNGKMNITANGSDYTVSMTAFTVEMDNIKAFYENAIVSFNEYDYNSFSATITGYSIDDSNRVDMKNFTIVKNNESYTVDGLLKTSCIGGWIEMKTISAIYISYYNSCPSAGEILVTGSNSSLRTIFNSDQSINVLLNGNTYKNYENCLKLPSVEDVCQ